MHNKDIKRNKEQYIANRKKIIQLSINARILIEMEEVESVNEGLIMMYEQENPQIEEFNTFAQWKLKGYTIQKGAKSFLVWGQPRQVSQIPEGSEEAEDYKYWPLCYLFADTQVFKPTRPEPAAQQEAEPEPANVVEMDAILN